MAKKEFRYKGKSVAELKELSIKEFAKIIPARLRRTLNRGLTAEQKIFVESLDKKKDIKTHCRDLVILPLMIGKKIRIHSGKEFQSVTITEEMIGHVLGEFVLTRKRVAHNAPGIGATRSSASASVK